MGHLITMIHKMIYYKCYLLKMLKRTNGRTDEQHDALSQGKALAKNVAHVWYVARDFQHLGQKLENEMFRW